jgi:hypothetical protein
MATLIPGDKHHKSISSISKNKTAITRRKFVEGIAVSAACCAWFPLEGLASPYQDKPAEGGGKEHLAAVCGTYCGACPAYLARHSDEELKKKRMDRRLSSGPAAPSKAIPDPRWMDGLLCDGCLSGGQLAFHCQRCAIKVCAAGGENVTRCSDCDDLPCSRVMNMVNTGLLHRGEYLPNLRKMSEMGVSGMDPLRRRTLALSPMRCADKLVRHRMRWVRCTKV